VIFVHVNLDHWLICVTKLVYKTIKAPGDNKHPPCSSSIAFIIYGTHNFYIIASGKNVEKIPRVGSAPKANVAVILSSRRMS